MPPPGTVVIPTTFNPRSRRENIDYRLPSSTPRTAIMPTSNPRARRRDINYRLPSWTPGTVITPSPFNARARREEDINYRLLSSTPSTAIIFSTSNHRARRENITYRLPSSPLTLDITLFRSPQLTSSSDCISPMLLNALRKARQEPPSSLVGRPFKFSGFSFAPIEFPRDGRVLVAPVTWRDVAAVLEGLLDVCAERQGIVRMNVSVKGAGMSFLGHVHVEQCEGRVVDMKRENVNGCGGKGFLRMGTALVWVVVTFPYFRRRIKERKVR